MSLVGRDRWIYGEAALLFDKRFNLEKDLNFFHRRDELLIDDEEMKNI